MKKVDMSTYPACYSSIQSDCCSTHYRFDTVCSDLLCFPMLSEYEARVFL